MNNMTARVFRTAQSSPALRRQLKPSATWRRLVDNAEAVQPRFHVSWHRAARTLYRFACWLAKRHETPSHPWRRWSQSHCRRTCPVRDATAADGLCCSLLNCWARLFLQHLRRRSWWIIRATDDRWMPASREISRTVRWLWGLSSWLNTSDSTVSTLSSVRALRRLPLPGRLSTVPNSLIFTSSLFRLRFVQPLTGNSVVNCRAL